MIYSAKRSVQVTNVRDNCASGLDREAVNVHITKSGVRVSTIPQGSGRIPIPAKIFLLSAGQLESSRFSISNVGVSQTSISKWASLRPKGVYPLVYISMV